MPLKEKEMPRFFRNRSVQQATAPGSLIHVGRRHEDFTICSSLQYDESRTHTVAGMASDRPAAEWVGPENELDLSPYWNCRCFHFSPGLQIDTSSGYEKPGRRFSGILNLRPEVEHLTQGVLSDLIFLELSLKKVRQRIPQEDFWSYLGYID